MTTILVLWLLAAVAAALEWQLNAIQTPLSERIGHGAVMGNSSVLVFGGRKSPTYTASPAAQELSEVVRYSRGEAAVLKTAGNRPSARMGHSVNVLRESGRLVVFGGLDAITGKECDPEVIL